MSTAFFISLIAFVLLVFLAVGVFILSAVDKMEGFIFLYPIFAFLAWLSGVATLVTGIAWAIISIIQAVTA